MTEEKLCSLYQKLHVTQLDIWHRVGWMVTVVLMVCLVWCTVPLLISFSLCFYISPSFSVLLPTWRQRDFELPSCYSYAFITICLHFRHAFTRWMTFVMLFFLKSVCSICQHMLRKKWSIQSKLEAEITSWVPKDWKPQCFLHHIHISWCQIFSFCISFCLFQNKQTAMF